MFNFLKRKAKKDIQECGTPIDELRNFPAINSDYSFMNDLDDYLMATTYYDGHYIKITLRKKDDYIMVKEIKAKTFEKLMEKTREWCLENNNK